MQGGIEVFKCIEWSTFVWRELTCIHKFYYINIYISTLVYSLKTNGGGGAESYNADIFQGPVYLETFIQKIKWSNILHANLASTWCRRNRRHLIIGCNWRGCYTCIVLLDHGWDKPDRLSPLTVGSLWLLSGNLWKAALLWWCRNSRNSELVCLVFQRFPTVSITIWEKILTKLI